MTENELMSIWNYYLSLEDDLAATSRYIEPAGQENTFSFEFSKLLVLACTEIESVLKRICYIIAGHHVEGDIGAYKQTILSIYPKITKATVIVSRLGKNIIPFSGWGSGRLQWWDAYQQVKHNRGEFFSQATYLNSVSAISALYILIFYLAEISGLSKKKLDSHYIDSDYSYGKLIVSGSKKLPDFEVST